MSAGRPTAVLLAVLLAASGCADSFDASMLVGDWSGRDVPAHFEYIHMRFERDGSGVAGKACRITGDTLGFTDIPVGVDGRRIVLRVPVGNTFNEFKAEFTGGRIVGAWSRSPETQVTLERGGSYCANAGRP